MADIQHDRTKPRAVLLRHFAKGSCSSRSAPPQEGIPEYSVSVDLKTADAEGASYELELRLRIEAGRAAERLYQLELAYAGIFALRNVAQADLTRLMLIDASSLFFPFARKLAGETMRNAGFAPLAIKAVDFAALYLSQKEEVPPPFGGELAAPGEVARLPAGDKRPLPALGREGLAQGTPTAKSRGRLEGCEDYPRWADTVCHGPVAPISRRHRAIAGLMTVERTGFPLSIRCIV